MYKEQSDMNQELVSVIMPSFNTAGFIERSIESVLKQTHNNLELIIVDDCSTDNTDDVIRPLLNDKRIKYIKNTENSGAAVSRNRAIAAAKGKWIAFLDSDDIWEKDKLEKQIKFMTENNYHFSYTAYCEIDTEDKPLGVIVKGPKKITKTGMYNYNWLGCLTVMYDAELVGLIQIEDIKKRNDYAIWLKVIRKTDCYFLNEQLARYRKRKGSISSNSYIKLLKYHYQLYRVSEHMGVIMSVFNTCRNMLFGVYKKKVYIKRI